MQTQLDSIVEKFRTLSIKLDELDELSKTLKISFDNSLMASESCYYLQSIIDVIRHKSVRTRDFGDSLHQKIIRFQLDNEKFHPHK